MPANAAALNDGNKPKNERRKKKKSSEKSSHLIEDNFMPKAWQNFSLDKDLILKLALNQ